MTTTGCVLCGEPTIQASNYCARHASSAASAACDRFVQRPGEYGIPTPPADVCVRCGQPSREHRGYPIEETKMTDGELRQAAVDYLGKVFRDGAAGTLQPGSVVPITIEMATTIVAMDPSGPAAADAKSWADRRQALVGEARACWTGDSEEEALIRKLAAVMGREHAEALVKRFEAAVRRDERCR